MAETTTIARGSFTVIDYTDAASITAGIQANKALTVISSSDNDTVRSSKWTDTAPLIVTPIIYMSTANGTPSNLASSLKSIAWSYQRSGSGVASADQGWKSLSLNEDSAKASQGICSDERFIIQPTTVSGGAIKNALLVKCDSINHLGEATPEPLLEAKKVDTISFRYDGIYEEESGMQTPVSGTITFTIIVQGSSATTLIISTPSGNIFTDRNQDPLKLIMELWRGSAVDFSDVAFRWYKKDDTSFTPIATNAATAPLAVKVSVPKNNDISVGSRFLWTSGTYSDLDALNTALKGDIGNSFYLGGNTPIEFEVVAIEISGDNALVSFKVVGAESGGFPSSITSTVTNNSWLIPLHYDPYCGGGWDLITAQSLAESIVEGLGTSAGGPYLDPNIDTSSSSVTVDLDTANILGKNVLIVPSSAVTGLQIFKGVAYDLSAETAADPVNKWTPISSVVSVLDYTDPYQVTLYSPNGNIIRNKKGFIQVIAEVYSGGELVSNIGEMYFRWKLMDKDGNPVTKSPAFTYDDGSGTSEIYGKGSDTYGPLNIIQVDGTTISGVTPNYDRIYLCGNDIVQKGTVTCEVLI